jgi:arginase
MQKTIQLIGAPMDLGQNHRGVDMGPSAIRYAGLEESLIRLGYTVRDLGNLPVPQRHGLGKLDREKLYSAIHQGCEMVCEAACNAMQAQKSAIFLGGDHTIAIGSISGLTCKQELGVLWIDAHGDSNTPQSSLTGNIHGMPLSVLLGHGHAELVNVGGKGAKLRPENVVLVGVRDFDPSEKKFLNDLGVHILTMRNIDERGMGKVMQEALHKLSHCQQLHVSLDMDCLDPQTAPGVGTPCPGGITYREAQLAMEIIADTGRCNSLDLVEINPILDHGNKTAQVAVDLAVSLAGKTIL